MGLKPNYETDNKDSDLIQLPLYIYICQYNNDSYRQCHAKNVVQDVSCKNSCKTCHTRYVVQTFTTFKETPLMIPFFHWIKPWFVYHLKGWNTCTCRNHIELG